MTTSNAANMKTVGYPLPGAKERIQMRFDFSKGDGAATNTYNLFKAANDLVITGFHAVVKTAVTSAGSATIAAGVTGTTNAFWGTATGAKANLTAAALVLPDVVEGTPNVISIPKKIASGDYVTATVGTAVLTAGVIEFTLEVMRL